MVGNLNSLRTIADVRDAVRVYLCLLPRDHNLVKVIILEEVLANKTNIEFLLKNSFVSGIKVKIDKNRLRPIDADLQIPDTSKFKKHTNWKPHKFENNDGFVKLLERKDRQLKFYK